MFTRDSQPLQWAFGQNNIGDVHWNRASQGGGKPDYRKAIELFENAKQGFTQAGYTLLIPLTDQKIDLIKQDDGRRSSRLAVGRLSAPQLVFLPAFASLYADRQQGWSNAPSDSHVFWR